MAGRQAVVTLSESLSRRRRGPVLRTLLRSALPAVLVLGLLVVAPTTATAQDACLPAGGVDDDPPHTQIQYDGSGYDRTVAAGSAEPFTETSHDVIFSGGGWGHGVGLSQFAAQGAAKEFGCTHQQILQEHFPGTGLESRSSRDQLRLKVFTTGGSGTPSVWAEQDVWWQQCQQNDDGTVREGTCTVLQESPQPAGSTWTVRREGGAWRIKGPGIDRSLGSDTHTVLRARHNERLVRVKPDGGASAGSGLHVRYGMLELDYTSLGGGRLFATQIINGQDKHPQLSVIDTYLLGLAEVPFAWHAEALRTQVIAARSFAEATARNRQSWSESTRISTLDCRCDLRVDTGDQVWAGATKQQVEPTYYPNWEQAVRDTQNRYVVQDGSVLTTFYSSSHGGWSRAGFNSNSSAYASVDVSRWEKASGNPRYRWSQGFSVTQLERAFGIDDIDGLQITETDAGGYPLKVRVTGVDDGVEVTRELDPYQQVRNTLGLYGPRFHIHVVNDLANDDRIPVARVAGDDRIRTAIRLSADGWSQGSDTVVLARQDVAADALTGSALAGTHDAPLLLTERDQLLPVVADEIERLGASTVILLGGPNALSRQVELDLTALGIADVQRVQGEDRHGTAADIASRVARGDESTAYLVRLAAPNPAVGWVDALSVAGVAARRGGEAAGWPVLGTDATIPDATRQAIAELGITRVVPVGGPNTIPRAALDELRDLGVEVAGRLAGEDRYGTSRAVAATDQPVTQSLAIATGENFPDGLAAGPYAARTGGTLLLVPRTTDPAPVWDADQHPAFVRSFGWEDPSLTAVGGPAAIENGVVSRVASALESGRPHS